MVARGTENCYRLDVHFFSAPTLSHPSLLVCSVDKLKISRRRLEYVNVIEHNRREADGGRPYHIEVWTDESYVHHHHHLQYTWLGDDAEEVFARSQWKGMLPCEARSLCLRWEWARNESFLFRP